TVALTGSDFGATLDTVSVPQWASFHVKPSQTLRLGPTRSGARCYLCVQGGIVVEPLLGSASTHLLSRLGGHKGRALRKADVLRMGGAPRSSPRHTRESGRPGRVSSRALAKLTQRKALRATPGPQSDWFPQVAQRVFFESTSRVAEESNRMGLRLEGPPIPE